MSDERAVRVDGRPGLVALSALGSVFRSCLECGSPVATLVRLDGTLLVSCGKCGQRWKVAPSGRITAVTWRLHDEQRFYAAAFGHGRPSKLVTVEVEADRPSLGDWLSDGVAALREAWAAS
jgi:hypothetical protein